MKESVVQEFLEVTEKMGEFPTSVLATQLEPIEESWWARKIRLYGHNQRFWWAKMPIDERVDMVEAIIESGAIPVFVPSGGNTLHLRGATHQEVVDCIIILLEDRHSESTIKWFDWMQVYKDDEDFNRRFVREYGARVWLMSLDSI